MDLPEIIPFSCLYLNKIFPNAQFLLPNEANSEAISGFTSGFVFLCPDQLELVQDQSVDFAVNTASFGEMMPHQIGEYFHFLRRVMADNGMFFTTNRVEKWMNKVGDELEKNTAESGVAIRFHEYPWSGDDEDLFFHLSEFHTVLHPENPMFTRLTRLARQ